MLCQRCNVKEAKVHNNDSHLCEDCVMISDNEELKAVFANPKVQEAAVDLFVRKRPMGWGRRSIAPYFNEHYGREAKAVLDEMMKSRQDVCYHYSEFLKKFGINKETLYLRVNQSMRYVVEMMDDKDHTYGRFMAMLIIRRIHGLGVTVRFRPECRDGNISDFKPKPVDAKDEVPRWKEHLNDWLENSEPGDKPFLKEGLTLTATEIEDLNVSLKQVKGIMFNVTSFSVKIIKVNS